ncbi:MAG TPA: hypothetical protein VLH85_04295 [Levilinea sp.]|nr:hypothetical protein [Levilinea sp.]
MKGDSSSDPPVNPVMLDMTGCHRLAAAIILQAVQEAIDADPDCSLPAREWLAADGLIWMRLLSMNPRALAWWLKKGCPRDQSTPALDSDDAYQELLHWCQIIVTKRRKRRFFPR